jgi:hemolysin activation/secretion protein
LALVGSNLLAQVPVYDPKQVPTYDAGALTRQAEQLFKQSQMQNSQSMRTALPPEMVFDDSAPPTVTRFKFAGNRRMTTEQLQAVTASFANRPLNSKDVKHLTDAVSEAYRQAGWLVQAYVPRQEITGAELTIQVIETIPPSRPAR